MFMILYHRGYDDRFGHGKYVSASALVQAQYCRWGTQPHNYNQPSFQMQNTEVSVVRMRQASKSMYKC